MASDLKSVEKKLDKIDNLCESLLLWLSDKSDTSSLTIDDLMECIDEACLDEKITLVVSQIGLNASKLSDIDEAKRNHSVLDRPEFERTYSRNLTPQQREIVRQRIVGDNKVNFDVLSQMGIEYAEVKDEKDYLDFKTEVKTSDGIFRYNSVYDDLRKYNDSQIESDVAHRTIYHMIMEHQEEMESLMVNDDINEIVTDVLTAMHLKDLEKVCENDGIISSIAQEVGALNEDSEICVTKTSADIFNSINSVIESQKEESYELDDDDFGFEENDILDEDECDDEDTLE